MIALMVGFMHETLPLAMVYFFAGLTGTGCRVALSPTMEFGPNKRTIVEVIAGGVGGIILPYVGFGVLTTIGVPKESSEAFPVIVKAALVWFLSFGVSLGLGDVLARARQKNGGTP